VTVVDPSLVKWDRDGLCVAVAQDRLTGRVQMVAWMNREALRTTLESRRATFYSRSRKSLWTKGETSGHFLEVESVHLDCDGDTILVLVRPIGPSCHTGKETCFFQTIEGTEGPPASPMLDELESEIDARKRSTDPAKPSYTRTLLAGGAAAIGAKLREEADELARAIDAETPDRVASEAADVLYHLMVGIASRDVSIRAVLDQLKKRRAQSGIEEKQARKPK